MWFPGTMWKLPPDVVTLRGGMKSVVFPFDSRTGSLFVIFDCQRKYLDRLCGSRQPQITKLSCQTRVSGSLIMDTFELQMA
jgi:hypothetical protein